MKVSIQLAGLAIAALTTLLAAGCTEAQSDEPAPVAAEAEPTSFVAADFEVPTLVEGDGFQLVPLGPALVDVDFQAYMSSIEHLQQTFTRSTAWPHEDISAEDAMLDMETEQGRFERRESFAYGVLTLDGSRERGSVYVRPSPVAGYDAVVMLWVTKDDYDAGFDAELYDFVTGWVESDWPFANVAYPGRAIDWESWDALVADAAGDEASSAE